MMVRIVLLAAACILSIGLSLSGCGPAGDEVVTFPDANLETAIREALDKPSGPFHASELARLSDIDASRGDIENLSGLQYCTSLTHLDCSWNRISDVSPLVGLTSLTVFKLGYNSDDISDISPLANLTNLTYLDLGHTQISDISPLVENEGLGAADTVHLSGNPLSSDSISIYISQLEARGVTVYY